MHLSRGRKTTHGQTNTKLYHIWTSMKKRCYNKNSQNYSHYGGRGIKICQEWRDDFMNFYNWAMNNGYKEGLTIDRTDVDKDYSPSNCQWANWKTQQRNRTNTRYITINDETRSLSEWCEILSLNYKRVYQRLYRDHWSIEKALEL